MDGYIKNKITIIVGVILFFIPFFWFSHGNLDLGGDSTRLYFYDPLSWLNNIALYSDNALSGLGSINPNFLMIPFLGLLLVLRIVFVGNAHFLNCFFYGLLLSGSFLFTNLSIKEIVCQKKAKYIDSVSIIGGLFFSFSQVIANDWQRALYFMNGMLVYPMIFYLFLRYLKSEKIKFIFIAAIISFIFSLNFSFATVPWFFAFSFFSFIFLFVFSLTLKKTRVFVNGAILFLSLLFLTQAFHIFPQIDNVLDRSTSNNNLIFSNEGKNIRGLDYFLSIQPYTRLIYNIENQQQYDILVRNNDPKQDLSFVYGIRYQYLFFIYILIIIFGGLVLRKKGAKEEKAVYAVLSAIFLALLFLMTASINDAAVEFYKGLFSIPGFAMFRSYYTKFSMVFVFFYALLLAVSLRYILIIFENKLARALLLTFLFILIVFNGWPLISGKIANATMWQSMDVKGTINVSNEFLSFVEKIKNDKLDSKYMDFPLTNESYQVVQGQNGGVYSGPSFTATLTGKKDFTGLGAFAKFSGIVRDSLKNKDYPMLERLLSIMNVGKIIHNTDGYIYKNFPTYPYTTELKEIFPDQESMSGFIQKLDYKKNIQVGNEFNLFSSTDGFLPHFYTSRESIVSGRTVDNLPRIFSSSEWQTRSVIFLVGQNVGKEMMLKKILDNDQNLSDGILSSNQSDNIPDDSMITSRLSENSNTLPVLEFKKIDPIKYRVRVHGASGVFPLIFSESFHDGWKVYLNQNVNLKNRNDNLGNYKILDGNAEDQATKDELQNYIAKSYITDLGSGSNKTIKHKEWVGGKEQLDYMEKYNVDFVSKNFQGSIQNDNLPNGNIFETWFQKPLNNNNNHLMANGYANSWVIDTDEICANSNVKCIKNADGTYDFELVVEFWPQRLFYIGLVLSGVALLGCFIYLGYGWRRRNKSCKYYYSDF